MADRMIYVIAGVLTALLLGFIILGLAGKIFPHIPQFACNFLRQVSTDIAKKFAGCG